uniref:RING-type domain-containing protein n=1 Tax=Anopheles atroparvus TaxID=41427 RepID=A0A182J2B7_ANOAO
MTTHAERLELRRTLSVDLHTVQNNLQGRTSRWETFKNIRNKRQDRLRGKLRKRKFDGEDGFGLQLTNINCQSCPVCHGRLQRTQEEIAQHIEECVRKDETVDVESYGDETSNGAINMSSNVIHHTSAASGNGILHGPGHNNNNNNNHIIKPDNSVALTKLPPLEESAISSLSSIVPHWDRGKPRLNLPLNCKQGAMVDEPRPWTTVVKPRLMASSFEGGPQGTGTAGGMANASNAPTDHSITRVTPTSSDQRIDVDYDQEHDHSQDMITDNDEEVIVDNTDDEECMKPVRPPRSTAQHLNGHPQAVASTANGAQPNDSKNSTEEATSSVEIDSATDSMSLASRTAGTTPNSDSYVSTSESAEPSSKAQVLEELKARIRELEGSPHYKCFICKEKCKTLIISKICGHYLCEECWITESESSKSCPRCKIITANSDFRKIHA